jgi:hypothetical protein
MGRLFIEPIEMLFAWAAKNDDALSKLGGGVERQSEEGSIILSNDRPAARTTS